jgi:hypothetical protein
MRKRRWFLLGLIGTLVGMAVKVVRGRREDEMVRPPPGEG